ncbi:MAG: glycosyltransferase family 4 protein [Fibrobacter sp.]|nr:glycosyltransferase family 4 protein [Fibrobacter sp.]
MPGNNKKKVVFLNHWAKMLGGAELSLIDILKETALRADVVLICSEDGLLIKRCTELGISSMIIPCKGNLGEIRRSGLLGTAFKKWKDVLGFFFYVLSLRSVIFKIDPDAVHANVPKSHMALFIIAALGYKKAAIFHIREIFDPGSFPFYLYRFLFPVRKSAAIAISNAVKNSLPKRVSEKTVLIHNGIEIPPSRISRDGPPRFLYLGRVVPWKGCHLLIKAFSVLFKKYGPDAGTLDIIGSTLYWSESYRDKLNNQIASDCLSGKVSLLPHTDSPQSALVNHDVLCMASDREPFGRVAAEAQGASMPVVGFNSGGLPEIVENGITGILVQNGNTDKLAEAMEQFVVNPSNIEQMGKAGHERVLKLFNRHTQIPLIADFILKNHI